MKKTRKRSFKKKSYLSKPLKIIGIILAASLALSIFLATKYGTGLLVPFMSQVSIFPISDKSSEADKYRTKTVGDKKATDLGLKLAHDQNVKVAKQKLGIDKVDEPATKTTPAQDQSVAEYIVKDPDKIINTEAEKAITVRQEELKAESSSNGSTTGNGQCGTLGSPVKEGTWVATGANFDGSKEGDTGARACVKCGSSGYEKTVKNCADLFMGIGLGPGETVVLPPDAGWQYTGLPKGRVANSCFSNDGGDWAQVGVGSTSSKGRCGTSGNWVDNKTYNEQISTFCAGNDKCKIPLIEIDIGADASKAELDKLADAQKACRAGGEEYLGGKCVPLTEFNKTKQDCAGTLDIATGKCGTITPPQNLAKPPAPTISPSFSCKEKGGALDPSGKCVQGTGCTPGNQVMGTRAASATCGTGDETLKVDFYPPQPGLTADQILKLSKPAEPWSATNPIKGSNGKCPNGSDTAKSTVDKCVPSAQFIKDHPTNPTTPTTNDTQPTSANQGNTETVAPFTYGDKKVYERCDNSLLARAFGNDCSKECPKGNNGKGIARKVEGEISQWMCDDPSSPGAPASVVEQYIPTTQTQGSLKPGDSCIDTWGSNGCKEACPGGSFSPGVGGTRCGTKDEVKKVMEDAKKLKPGDKCIDTLWGDSCKNLCPDGTFSNTVGGSYCGTSDEVKKVLYPDPNGFQMPITENKSVKAGSLKFGEDCSNGDNNSCESNVCSLKVNKTKGAGWYCMDTIDTKVSELGDPKLEPGTLTTDQGKCKYYGLETDFVTHSLFKFEKPIWQCQESLSKESSLSVTPLTTAINPPPVITQPGSPAKPVANSAAEPIIPVNNNSSSSENLNMNYTVTKQNGVSSELPGTNGTLTDAGRGCVPYTAYNLLKYAGYEVTLEDIEANTYWGKSENGYGTNGDATANLIEQTDPKRFIDAYENYDKGRIDKDANQLKSYTGMLIYSGHTDGVAHVAGFVCNKGDCVVLDSNFGDGKPAKCTVESSSNVKCGDHNYTVGESTGTPDSFHIVPGSADLVGGGK